MSNPTALEWGEGDPKTNSALKTAGSYPEGSVLALNCSTNLQSRKAPGVIISAPDCPTKAGVPHPTTSSEVDPAHGSAVATISCDGLKWRGWLRLCPRAAARLPSTQGLHVLCGLGPSQGLCRQGMSLCTGPQAVRHLIASILWPTTLPKMLHVASSATHDPSCLAPLGAVHSMSQSKLTRADAFAKGGDPWKVRGWHSFCSHTHLCPGQNTKAP